MPIHELLIDATKKEGVCTVCKKKTTRDLCASCNRSHYICPGCTEKHRFDKFGN
jgi:hypothetical protein